MPSSVRVSRAVLLVDGVVGVLLEARDDAVDGVVLVGRLLRRPEMMSGVRASSIRMLSTSSTIAKCSSRWTYSSRLNFMLSRR
jgi:hypothetical protein